MRITWWLMAGISYLCALLLFALIVIGRSIMDWQLISHGIAYNGFIMRNPNGRMSPTEIKKQLAHSDTTAVEMLRFVFGSVLKRQ